MVVVLLCCLRVGPVRARAFVCVCLCHSQLAGSRVLCSITVAAILECPRN